MHLGPPFFVLNMYFFCLQSGEEVLALFSIHPRQSRVSRDLGITAALCVGFYLCAYGTLRAVSKPRGKEWSAPTA